MTSLKRVSDEVLAHNSMRSLIEVYEEMAAEAMRKIREAILSSRDYYRGLAKLSEEVGADIAQITDSTVNRRALVLLSSDRGMYGEITDRVFQRFLEAIKQVDDKTDIYITGKMGEEMMRLLAPKINFVTLDFDEAEFENSLMMLSTKLIHYRFVEMFFGQFGSVARQEAVSRTLSAAVVNMTQDKWAGDVSIKLSYIYEPNIRDISTLFGEQIFGGILEQTIKEDQLAKQASRLMHLDSAWNQVDKELKKSTRRYSKLHKRISGRKQNTTLASYVASKRGGIRL